MAVYAVRIGMIEVHTVSTTVTPSATIRGRRPFLIVGRREIVVVALERMVSNRLRRRQRYPSWGFRWRARSVRIMATNAGDVALVFGEDRPGSTTRIRIGVALERRMAL